MRDFARLMAIGVAVVLVVALTWVDVRILVDARRTAAAQFNVGGYLPLATLAILAVTGAILALGALAWRARSVLVGLVYTLGGLLLIVPFLIFGSVTSFPDWANEAITTLLSSTNGPIGAGGFLGAGLLLSGLVGIASGLTDRRRRSGSVAYTAATPSAQDDERHASRDDDRADDPLRA